MVSMTATRVIQGERVRRPSFVCNELATGGCGSMRIKMSQLERYVREQLFTRADSPALRAAMSATSDDIDEAEQSLRKSISDGERRLERVEDEYDAEEITKAEYRRRRSKILERLDADRAALARATRSRVHTRLPSGAELRAAWADRDDTWRRTVFASVIERIEVSRHPAGVASNLTPRRAKTPRRSASGSICTVPSCSVSESPCSGGRRNSLPSPHHARAHVLQYSPAQPGANTSQAMPGHRKGPGKFPEQGPEACMRHGGIYTPLGAHRAGPLPGQARCVHEFQHDPPPIRHP